MKKYSLTCKGKTIKFVQQKWETFEMALGRGSKKLGYFSGWTQPNFEMNRLVTLKDKYKFPNPANSYTGICME